MPDCSSLPDPFYSYNKDEVAFCTRIQSLETDPIPARLKPRLESRRFFRESFPVSFFSWAQSKDFYLHRSRAFLRSNARFSPCLGENNRRQSTAKIMRRTYHTDMYLSFSLHLSSYLSLRSDINCLLPNLIRNFRRRDNLTSFLFSLTRSEPLLYGGLVPRIFLSVERVCERTSERPCSSLPIQFISLRSTHVVRSCLSLSRSPIVPSRRHGRDEKEYAKLTDGE